MIALLERPPMDQQSQARNEAVAELVLLAIPSAITCARLLLELAARHWSLAPTFVDAARDLLDELIAHAVASTGVTDLTPVQHLRSEQLTLLGIRLAYGSQTLRIEVWDTGSGPLDNLLATSPALAAVDHWTVDLPKPGQRVVWCVLSRESSAEQTVRLPVPKPRRAGTAAGKTTVLSALRRELEQRGVRRSTSTACSSSVPDRSASETECHPTPTSWSPCP